MLIDVCDDLFERLIVSSYADRPGDRPDNRFLPLPFLIERNTACMMLMMSFYSEHAEAYYMTTGGQQKIPPEFWRESDHIDSVTSGMTPDHLSGEPEWIYIPREQYRALVALYGMDRCSGKLELETEPTSESLRPGPMTALDLQRAVELLRMHPDAKNMARPAQREFLRKNFPGSHILDDNFLSIFKQVPMKRGRPRKSGENSVEK
ncbi:hypothetical protein QA634_34940 [Methylobacterium sp. CB376]|uniref:hypothetical protein n=1 Tax=unclassified Methylobacterium TaxID=2615210 RepID=UPI001237A019|nr:MULTISPECIES: hypothetical protein [Methylobacterium]WFT80302.1 hypothetical protein QA634_34940 [Methylobacterium nodulans]